MLMSVMSFFKTKHLNGYRNEGKHGYLEAFLYTFCSEMFFSRFHFISENVVNM